MEIRIIETGEKAELSIIDSKSGVNWINDLMGNHNDLPEYDDDVDRYVMDQESYDWWKDLTTRYQAADDRYHELLGTIENDEYESLLDAAQNINCDLEDLPSLLEGLCDEYAKK